MSDCITAIIMAIVIALCLGDNENNCRRNNRNRCALDRCDPICGNSNRK